MNYNDAKKIINKLNGRLRTLQKSLPNSYTYAINQLKQLGPILTDNDTISTSKKKLDLKHLESQIESITAAVPTVADEIEHIKEALAQIDKVRSDKYKDNEKLLKKYEAEKLTRNRATLLSELNAKRYFDIEDLLDTDSLKDLYEDWKKKGNIVDKPDALIDLENEINEKLGKGRAAIRSYAELYEIKELLDEYFDDQLVKSAQLVNKADLQ